MCHIFICLIGNAFLFISFLGNIVNTLCVLSLTLILLKDALLLPINKPSPNQTSQRLQRRAEKNYGKIVVFFCLVLSGRKIRSKTLFLYHFYYQYIERREWCRFAPFGLRGGDPVYLIVHGQPPRRSKRSEGVPLYALNYLEKLRRGRII